MKNLLPRSAKKAFLAHVTIAILFFPFVVFGQLPTSFQKVDLITGLTNSINFEFAPDGRIFIVDRYGELRIYNPQTLVTVVAGKLNVYHDMEDGLLAIAFDPGFISNQYVYLHYSPASVYAHRVSRFTLNGNVLDLSSEVVVLQWPWERNGYFHAAGDMDFDSNGNLYVAIGDNTNHSSYATLNETDAAQSSERTSSNTNDLRGKIVRIHPEPNGSYTIPAGNLFPNGNGGKPEIYVMGARNPFKIFVDKTNTNWLFWGEVGPDASTASSNGPEGMDEINLTKSAGNYGWPYLSGKNKPYLNTYTSPNFYYDPANLVNLSKWNTGVKLLPPAQPAWLDFFHKCYLAGPRYYLNSAVNNPKKLPSSFDKAFFYYDFNTSKVWVVKMDVNGNALSTEQLAPAVVTGRGFIDLKIGPDGQLYVLEYGAGCCPSNVGTGKLVRFDYTGIDPNKSPEVTLKADVTSGSLPLTVHFSSDGTFDLNGDALTYQWDFQSDGIVDSNEKNPSFTYSQSGTFNALLRVDDSKGGISSKSVTVYAGNNKATFVFNSPADGGMMNWEDNINYDIVVNDPEDGSTADGTIGCSALKVIPAMGHLSHSHDGISISQCKGTYYLNPSGHDTQGQEDIYYLFKTNYTDAGGLISFDQVTVYPKIAQAEYYTQQSNTQKVDNTDVLGGGLYAVRALTDNSFIKLDGRNLINISSVSYRVASTVGGIIEIHADSPTGTLVSAVTIPVTGSLTRWENITGTINNPGGKHDLYFVFKKPGGANLFDLNYIEFKGPGVSIDQTPPGIYAIEALSKSQVSVKFNEPLDKISAELVSNYSINNDISIASAALQADRKTVILNTSYLTLQVQNQLTVSNIKNESEIALTQSILKTFTLDEVLVRINAGGPQVDLSGVVWKQNQYNSGGVAYANNVLAINNTTADAVYQSELNGTFTYNIPVSQDGIYDVKLHFAELIFKTTGARLFNVNIENSQYTLINYDIFARAGYATALIENFYGVVVEDGSLTITFTGVKDNAKVSAIEVFYGKETQQNPSVAILNPSNSQTVIQPFKVNFKANYWPVGSGTSHIHKFVDGVDLGDVTNPNPIEFTGLSLGTHTIKLVLANANHTLTGFSDQIQVNVVQELACVDNPFPLQWTEKVIGGEVPYRSPYIFPGDINGDGFKDVVTGAWWYRNPGSSGGTWSQNLIGAPMNNMSLLYDFDKDGDLDIFGTQGTYVSAKMAWAENDGSGHFTIHTNIPAGTSTYAETFMAGAALGNYNGVENIQIAIVWNGAESSHSPVQMLTVPADPINQAWTIRDISPDAVGEAITAGDIDKDGDLDLFQGSNWLRNDNGFWTTFSTKLTLTTHFDRNALADLDRDGILDAVVNQLGSNQPVSWFTPPADPTLAWTKKTIGTDVDGGLSLDVADIDFDGDLDVITGEWKDAHRLIAFENDLCNTGTWITHILHPGGITAPDHHDGAQTVDIDNDGDLDIISMGWDKRVPRIYVNSRGTNAPPVVSTPIPDQTATAGTNFTYAFPSGTFTDPNNDPLTYTATLSTGSALPAWLGFTSSTRTFSGTAPGAATTLTIKVTASDGKGGSVSDAFVLTVKAAVSSVVTYRINAGGSLVSNSIGTFAADAYFSGGTARYFNRTISGTTDGGTIYKYERSGGTFGYAFPVSSGQHKVVLHFAEIYWTAAGKRVFDVSIEGTKVLDDYDIFAKVGANRATTETFTVNVSDGTLNIGFVKAIDNAQIAAIEVIAPGSTNQPPVAAAGPDRTITLPTNSVVLTGSGTDPEGSTLSYGWSKVSGPAATLSGATTAQLTASGLLAGSYVFRLTVTDNAGASATDDVNVIVNATGTNAPPVVSTPIPDQTVTAGTNFTYAFPSGTFTDPNNDALTYTATLSTGSALPAWLGFTSSTRTFSGTAPGAATTLTIKVTASDGKGGSVSDAFVLTVKAAVSSVVAYRINAGGSLVTNSIGTFAADAYFSGGTARYFNRTISGTTDGGTIYKYERSGGTFGYAFPVSSGQYKVVLHFAEIYWTAAGKRVFDVSIEGTKVLDDYDIFAKVGANRATTETFTVNVSDGTLNIGFVKAIDNAQIAAIEVYKINTTGTARISYAETGEELPVHYYPNPFIQSFTLKITGKGEAKLPLKIYDVYGRQVLQLEDVLPEQVVRMGKEFAPGVYTITLGQGSQVKRYRLVKGR